MKRSLSTVKHDQTAGPVSPLVRIALQKLRSRSGLRDEPHRDAVHAIAQSRRRRAVVENVTEMTEATCAMHLGARHEKRAVSLGLHGIRQWPIEARPACAALELGL